MELFNNTKLKDISSLEPDEENVIESSIENNNITDEDIDTSTESIKTTYSQKTENVIPIDTSPVEQKLMPNLYFSITEKDSGDGGRFLIFYLNESLIYRLPQFVQFLNILNENDDVIIEISETGLHILDTYAVMSAISTCKANVTTNLNFACTLETIAMWLCGKNLDIGRYSILIIQLTQSGMIGNTNDLNVSKEEIEKDTNRIKAMLLEKNILTKEEAESVFEKNKILTFIGSEIKERLAKNN